MEKTRMTVSYVISGDKILLGMKKVRFGQGLWNGFGGRVQEGESIESAAARELYEESGLRPTNMHKCAVVLATHENDKLVVELHIFIVTAFDGKEHESDEMSPRWFSILEIPYHEMWANDAYLIPLFLSGKKCIARVHFKDPKTIIHETIKFVEILPETVDEIIRL